MFFLTSEIHRCHRLFMQGHETLKVDYTAKTQLILGSNGCGKSSFFDLGLTVLPSRGVHFLPGGYRRNKVAHRGHHYELVSLFEGKTPRHEFWRDDVQMNKGGTEAVQLELVRQHLGMTPDLHRLLTGRERFTGMTPIRRREWIAELSRSNFEYAIGLYNRYRKGFKDTQAILKYRQQTLVAQAAKLQDPTELAQLREQADLLHGEIGALLRDCPSYQQVQDRRHRLCQQMEQSHRQYQQLTAALLSQNLPEASPGVDSLEALQRHINTSRDSLAALEGAWRTLGDQYDQVQQQYQQLEQLDTLDIPTLSARRVELEALLDELRSQRKTELPVEQLQGDATAQYHLQEFERLFHNVPLEGRTRFTQDSVTAMRRGLAQRDNAQQQLQLQIGSLEGRLEHIERCERVECPACRTSFQPGVTHDEPQQLRKALKEALAQRDRDLEEILRHRQYLDDYEAYRGTVQAVYQCMREHPELVGLWTLIERHGGLQDRDGVIAALRHYLHDAKLTMKLQPLEVEHDLIVQQLIKAEQLDAVSGGIRHRHQSLSGRIQELTQQIQHGKQELYRLQDVAQEHQRFTEDYQSLQQVLGAFQQAAEGLFEVEVHELQWEQIREHQTRLAVLENTLREAEEQRRTVDALEIEVAQLQIEETAYKTLVKLLSPTDGLIAEQAGAFINSMIHHINGEIARIWGYHLALVPIDLEQGELDYKFPMLVRERPREDISEGSTSIKDIIDQAFRQVTYKFLHLEDYPLYLDEPEGAFDPQHRKNIIPAIKTMVEDNRYSQVFLISHYLEGQGSFPQSQILVLDDSHVKPTRPYNQHATFR